jgi:predicted MFS family arabinose efflux permease
MVLQTATVVGFAAGGALLVLASPRELLALDATTFALSAVLVRCVPFGVTGVEVEGARNLAPRADLKLAARIVFLSPQLRPLVLLAWFMSAAAIAPEALAAPYADAVGASSSAVGVLLAAGPVGNVAAALAIARIPEARRLPLMWPLATLAAAPLVVCLVHPPFALVVALFALSGCGTAYHVVAMVRFVRLVEPEKRGRAIGLAASGLAVIQGVAVAVAGVVGDVLDPASAVGIAGVGGLLAAFVWGPALRSPESQVSPPGADAVR